jgi:hypothetical protein
MRESPPQARLHGHELIGVGLFTGLYMLVATAAAMIRGNAEFIIYISVMLVLIACIVVLHRHVPLSSKLLWGLSIWGALHMAGGLVSVPESWPTHGEFRVLYSWWIIPKDPAGGPDGWLKFDQIVHAYGFAVATWLCWQGLCGAVENRNPKSGRTECLRATPGLMVLVALSGMGLGALNEVVEFIATRITVTNVGGYVNTGWDLVYNMLGATIAALILYLRRDSKGRRDLACNP